MPRPESELPTTESPWMSDQMEELGTLPEPLFGPPENEIESPEITGIQIVWLSPEVRIALGFAPQEQATV